MKFPDFIIVGAMKCGTTALWRNLNKHPEITMGRNPDDLKSTSTEIRFWNNAGPYHTWDNGIEWYKNLFSGKCCGEKCANYIDKESTMRLISEHIPDVKIILCVRNPILRAYSEFQMQLKTIPTKRNRKFNWKSSGRQNRGKYYKMIKQKILPFFHKNQIYICIQERMYDNTNKELNKLYNFLNVSEFDIKVKQISFEDRDKKLSVARKWKTDYTPINPKIYSKMQELYKKDNEKLFDFLGYEIKEWL